VNQSLLIALREALQCSAVLLLVRAYLIAEDRKRDFVPLLAGTLVAIAVGFTLGFTPGLAKKLPANETWAFMRYLAELCTLYLGLAFVLLRPREPSRAAVGAAFFILGFSIAFFEARAFGFILLDTGLMEKKMAVTVASGLGGLVLGLLPVFLARKWFDRLRIPRGLTVATLLISIAVLEFAFGSLGEFEEPAVFIAIERGIRFFLASAKEHFMAAMMLEGHTFLHVPFKGLVDYLFGDRVSMAAMLVIVTAPPIAALVDIFGRPSPFVSDMDVAAQKRLSMAFFRRELVNQSVPVLASLFVIIILVHAMNISLNPMYEPTPVPVRVSGDANVIRISTNGNAGDFGDGLLRKYVYFYGNKQITFLAVQKSDGTVGVALDECEICKPAEWNKAAQGYAQRGDHLVCKYCMTPIATSTVNDPGGCNPIPIPFWVDGSQISIRLDELIRVYNEARALNKKGTHL